jgi:hypothetical protein
VCTGIKCRENLEGSEGGSYAQLGFFWAFKEGTASGGGCKGGGAGFEFGLGLGGFKCKTFIGDSWGGIK